MELTNKVALITGGASGMGAATALWLAKHGMRIAILDYDPAPRIGLPEKYQWFSVQTEVGDSESVKTAITNAVAQLGAIHICINCAGIAPAARIVGRQGPMALEDFQRVIQINLIGTFNVMRLAAAQMMQQDSH